MRAAVLLALAASAMAYRMTSPNDKRGWSCKGPNTMKWERVSSDAKSFDVMLTNQDPDVMDEPMVVARGVKGADRTATVKAPKEGWPEGEGFRLNMVRDEERQSHIYAQSMPFEIVCDPETATPDAATPDAATPDTPTPEAATPEAATPESQAGSKSESKHK
ncbi:hypothetical protein BDZ89DRAFT_951334 [Hymenopellis radicata]|nr:hypothetical protein BDZ89DRAFT_951334 [Hymenopellis radicata]